MSANDSNTSSCTAEQHQKVTVAYTNQPCRRKLQFINGKFAVQKPQTTTVQKRNERERSRVKLINRTFTILRDRLPPKYSGKKERKLSKVEVLKTATSYIAYLVRILEEDDCKRKAASNASGSGQQQQQQQQFYTNSTQKSQSQTSLPSPCGDLADLLNDESLQVTPNQQQQQQQQQLHQQSSTETREVAPIGTAQGYEGKADDDDPESGIFQLSSEADFSSPGSLQQQQHQHQQPFMSQLPILPIVPPPVNTSCIAVSTPIKPIVQDVNGFTGSVSSSGGSSGIELIGTAYFYPVTAAAAFAGIGSSIDFSTIGESQEFQFVTISDLSDSYASCYQYF